MKIKNDMVDISKLREFTGGKIKLMINTINVIIDEIPKDIESMENALNKKDWDRLRSISHRIKPNFMLVAIEEIYENVMNIEKYTKERTNLDEIPGLMEKLHLTTPPLIEELKKEVIRLQLNKE